MDAQGGWRLLPAVLGAGRCWLPGDIAAVSNTATDAAACASLLTWNAQKDEELVQTATEFTREARGYAKGRLITDYRDVGKVGAGGNAGLAGPRWRRCRAAVLVSMVAGVLSAELVETAESSAAKVHAPSLLWPGAAAPHRARSGPHRVLQEQVRPVWGMLVAAAAPCCQWYLPAYTWGLPHTLAS